LAEQKAAAADACEATAALSPALLLKGTVTVWQLTEVLFDASVALTTTR
jgi:hypothetical protein